MRNPRFLALLTVLAVGVGLVLSCSTGDDDDTADDDTADDDSSDDDAADDDSGGDHPCEDVYDVIISGDYADDFPWITTWTTKYVINEDDTTVGIVIPDAPGWMIYDALGARTAPGFGYSDGSFPTPEDLNLFCLGGTVQIHTEYSVTDDVFAGEATYYCPNKLGPFSIFGIVTCGSP